MSFQHPFPNSGVKTGHAFPKQQSWILLSSDRDTAEGDGGWYDDEGEEPSISMSLQSTSKATELRQLQQATQQKQQQVARSSRSQEPPERDLFIPIFAIVSLAGLFGSYGYEMLRLYSRGELYLPWNN